jgi:hypothetical protein
MSGRRSRSKGARTESGGVRVRLHRERASHNVMGRVAA